MVDTKTLVNQVVTQSRNYTFYDAYFSGNQPLTYSTKKYRDAFARMLARYAENLCPAVVEGVNDRLSIEGIEIEGADTGDVATRLWNIWRDNRMTRYAKQTHFRALLGGNSYVIVWPNPRMPNGVEIASQPSEGFAVDYGESGVKNYAVKLWRDDENYARLTVYYADHIERWRSKSSMKDKEKVQESTQFTELTAERVVNPFGVVPVFHFINSTTDNSGLYGLSELRDVVPIQDALNKSVTDLLVAMEFSAYKQRWATGIDIEVDEETGIVKPAFEPGQDRIFATSNSEAKFGTFENAELEQFIRVHDMFVLSVARVTGTPLHQMLLSSTVFPSGEALKTAESRFTGKIEDRQIVFGETWEDVFRFAAQISGVSNVGRVDVKWKLAVPRSEKEFGEIAALKKGFGVSNKMLQREAGYTEEQVKQMEKENKEAMPAPIPASPNNANNDEQEGL